MSENPDALRHSCGCVTDEATEGGPSLIHECAEHRQERLLAHAGSGGPAPAQAPTAAEDAAFLGFLADIQGSLLPPEVWECAQRAKRLRAIAARLAQQAERLAAAERAKQRIQDLAIESASMNNRGADVILALRQRAESAEAALATVTQERDEAIQQTAEAIRMAKRATTAMEQARDGLALAVAVAQRAKADLATRTAEGEALRKAGEAFVAQHDALYALNDEYEKTCHDEDFDTDAWMDRCDVAKAGIEEAKAAMRAALAPKAGGEAGK